MRRCCRCYSVLCVVGSGGTGYVVVVDVDVGDSGVVCDVRVCICGVGHGSVVCEVMGSYSRWLW